MAQVDIELSCKVRELELERLVKLAYIEHDGLADKFAQVVLSQLRGLDDSVAQETSF